MKPLLEIKNLNINYKNSIKAVKDVNFTLEDNQIISIVGESGSGKSTLIRAILKLLPMGGEIESGNIFFLGKDILSLNKNELNSLRGKDIGMIFQDPNSTMDPIKTIEKQFIEYILEHNDMPKKEAIELAKEYLLKLNLTDVNRVLKFSLILFNSLITCACTVTSRALVGSSASNNRGLCAIAIAMATLCFIPPESSKG